MAVACYHDLGRFMGSRGALRGHHQDELSGFHLGMLFLITEGFG